MKRTFRRRLFYPAAGRPVSGLSWALGVGLASSIVLVLVLLFVP